jgi:hypothetical protein
MKKITILLLSFGLTFGTFANEKPNETQEKTLIKAQLVDTISVNTTDDIQARFVGLKEKAVEMGVDDIYINGKISYQPQGNYQKLKISWYSLENPQNLSKTNYSSLKQSFYSELTTDEEQILPPQEITIAVDEQVLMSALDDLLTKNDNSNKVELAEESVEKLNEPQVAANSAAANSSPYASSNLPEVDLNAQEVDNSTTTKEVECPIRYSVDDLRAYEQVAIHTVDSSGNTTNVGACLDTGTTYELKKSYGDPCSPLIGEDKVYQSYRITGIVAGQDEIVRDCQVDLTENTLPIQTTTDQCSYEHHLDLGLSYQTERKFYELDGEIVNISQCESNKKPYQHKEEVCSYDLEVSPGFAIPQVRTFIALDDGSESIVQNCTTRNEQIAVIEKECSGSDRYYHDFSASTSYLQKEKWVKNPYDNNNEVKVNNCQISETTFKHLETSDGCTPIYEDHNLRMTQSYKPYIIDNTQEPNEILLSETCGNATQIPYLKGDIEFINNGYMRNTKYTRPDDSIYQQLEPTEVAQFSDVGTFTYTISDGVTKIYTSIQGPAGYVNSTYDHCSNRYNPSTCVPSRSYIKVGNQTYYSPTGKTGDANTTSSYGLLYRYSGENYDTLYYAGYDNYTPNNYSLDVTPGQQITVYVRGGQSWQYNGEYGREGKAWEGHDGKVEIRY